MAHLATLSPFLMDKVLRGVLTQAQAWQIEDVALTAPLAEQWIPLPDSLEHLSARLVLDQTEIPGPAQ